MKIFLLLILFLTSCSTFDCSNRAARLNAQYEAQGIRVFIAVCPAIMQQYHAYILKDTEIIDAWTEKSVKRSLGGCLIFDDPEMLKPYMLKEEWEKEWTW